MSIVTTCKPDSTQANNILNHNCTSGQFCSKQSCTITESTNVYGINLNQYINGTQVNLAICPRGHYCSNPSVKEICPKYNYCSPGSVKPKVCSFSIVSCKREMLDIPVKGPIVGMLIFIGFVLYGTSKLFMYLFSLEKPINDMNDENRKKELALAEQKNLRLKSLRNQNRKSIDNTAVTNIMNGNDSKQGNTTLNHEEMTNKTPMSGKQNLWKEINRKRRKSVTTDDSSLINRIKGSKLKRVNEASPEFTQISTYQSIDEQLEQERLEEERNLLLSPPITQDLILHDSKPIHNPSKVSSSLLGSIPSHTNRLMKHEDILSSPISSPLKKRKSIGSVDYHNKISEMFKFKTIKHPIQIRFEHLNLYLLNKKNTQILDDLCGEIKPSHITALIGPSGPRSSDCLCLCISLYLWTILISFSLSLSLSIISSVM